MSNKLLNVIKSIDNYKIIIYIVYFFIYFLLYYMITIPKIMSNIDQTNIEISLNSNISYGLLIFFDMILLGLISRIFYISLTSKLNNISKLLYTSIPVALIGIILYFNILVFYKVFIKVSQSVITQYIYTTLNTLFYILFFGLFIYNLDNVYNVEFVLSIEILFLLTIQNIFFTAFNFKKIYQSLMSNDFSELTVNCFKNNVIKSIDKFENADNTNTLNTSNTSTNQITDIQKTYGEFYLKTIENIPISFLNKNTNSYQNLKLVDFYYPGSYYSYLVDTPLNGTPSLNALKISLSTFKTRIIHLDIFSDSNNLYNTDANPIVRCENMKDGAKPLKLEDCFATINKWAWITENPNKNSYPLFLYLKLNFDISNTGLCIKIYNMIIKNFSKYLIDKKYGYCGRNNMFPISNATMKEALNKIIIITDKYPTKTILDEIISGSSNDLSHNFNLELYKSSYITFDKIGLSQDNDKTTLINKSKTNMSFYYTLPNENDKNNNQPKAGMYNPSFQDCAQYGIQGTLMYIFLPDDNLNKWVNYFKTKNNLNPVLKDESLRLIDLAVPKIEKQDPLLALQKPQKYCLIPGMLSTEKSNLSTTTTNNSC